MRNLVLLDKLSKSVSVDLTGKYDCPRKNVYLFSNINHLATKGFFFLKTSIVCHLTPSYKLTKTSLTCHEILYGTSGFFFY